MAEGKGPVRLTVGCSSVRHAPVAVWVASEDIWRLAVNSGATGWAALGHWQFPMSSAPTCLPTTPASGHVARGPPCSCPSLPVTATCGDFLCLCRRAYTVQPGEASFSPVNAAHLDALVWSRTESVGVHCATSTRWLLRGCNGSIRKGRNNALPVLSVLNVRSTGLWWALCANAEFCTFASVVCAALVVSHGHGQLIEQPD